MSNKYTITTLDQPPEVLAFAVRMHEDGIPRYDYETANIAEAARIKDLLVAAGISGALKPPSNTRSTMARSVNF